MGASVVISGTWYYTFSGKENAGEALQRADSAMYKQKQVRAAAAGR